MSGDDFLSSLESTLWRIHQYILLKWGVYTIFRWERMNVPLGLTEYIIWFVPREASQCFEICQWLEHELEQFKREKNQYLPACETVIEVMEYSGIEPYMERDVVIKMAKEIVTSMLARLRKEKKNDT